MGFRLVWEGGGGTMKRLRHAEEERLQISNVERGGSTRLGIDDRETSFGWGEGFPV